MKIKKDIHLITAITKDFILGYKGKMPWQISKELKYFSEITRNSILIMGYNTWKSLPRPLRQRENLVLSNQERDENGAKFFKSIDEVLKYIEDKDKKVFVIGGRETYEQFLKRELIRGMYVSIIDFLGFDEGDIKYDILFPSELVMEKVKYRRIKEFIDEDKITGKKVKVSCNYYRVKDEYYKYENKREINKDDEQ